MGFSLRNTELLVTVETINGQEKDLDQHAQMHSVSWDQPSLSECSLSIYGISDLFAYIFKREGNLSKDK